MVVPALGGVMTRIVIDFFFLSSLPSVDETQQRDQESPALQKSICEIWLLAPTGYEGTILVQLFNMTMTMRTIEIPQGDRHSARLA